MSRTLSALGAAVLLAATGVAAAAALRPTRLRVTGESMDPTLKPGDRVVSVRSPLRGYQVGDLVVTTDPREHPRAIVKRLVAVEHSGFRLAGDNPSASTDSSTFGLVPRATIQGRVVYRYAPAVRAGSVSAARTPRSTSRAPRRG